MEHYYIFYRNENFNIYDRTCSTKEAAENRVNELKTIYEHSEYFENEIPKNYKWLY
jgi:hypothetical protein